MAFRGSMLARLTKDAQLKGEYERNNMYTFGCADDSDRAPKEGQARGTCFYEASCFLSKQSKIAPNLKKGAVIFIKSGSWETTTAEKDGVRVTYNNLDIKDLRLLTWPEKEDGGSQSVDDSNGLSAAPGPPTRGW